MPSRSRGGMGTPRPESRTAGWTRLAVWWAGVSVVVLLVLFGYSLRKPLEGNQIIYPLHAKVIAERGLHKFRLNPEGDLSYVNFHSPLYANLLALAFRVLGASDAVARGVNLLLWAGVFGIVLAAGRMLSFPGEGGREAGLVAVALLATNPAVIQSILTTDLDGTVLTFSFALVILAYMKGREAPPLRQGAWIALSVALAFWSKETTPVFLGGLLVAHALFSRGAFAGFWTAALSVFAGFTLFLVTYGLYSLFTDLPFLNIYENLKGYNVAPRTLASGLMNFLLQAKVFFVWLVLPLLLAGALVLRVNRDPGGAERSRRAWGFICLAGLGIAGIVTLVRGAILPRYQVPALPWVALMVGAGGWQLLARIEGAPGEGLPLGAPFWAAALVACLAYYYFAVPELVISTWGMTGARQAGDWMGVLARFKGPALFVLPWLLLAPLLKRKGRLRAAEALFLSVFLLMWPSQVAESAKHALSEGAAYFMHGRKGFSQLVDHLRQRAFRSYTILYNQVDLAFYLGNEIHVLTREFDHLATMGSPDPPETIDLEKVGRLIRRTPSLILVVYKGELPLNWDAFLKEYESHFREPIEIGDFRVYHRAGPRRGVTPPPGVRAGPPRAQERHVR